MNFNWKILLLSCALIMSLTANAQYNFPANNNWIFSNAGISFNNDTLTPLIGSQPTSVGIEEGGAAVSDDLGNLLFYSNGSDVWSANHALMPHSSNLILPYTSTNTATQSTLIVPSPNNTNQFYLFTLGVDNMNYYSRLYVYLIDMTLNNGWGDVDTSFYLTNHLLADSLTEKMIAVQGCGRTVWVVTKSLENGSFYSYRIDMSGIDTVPVISVAGNQPFQDYRAGAICASPNGQQIAVTSTYGLELMHFDGTNGKVTLQSNVQGPGAGHYGVAFSPSGRYLYSISDYIYQHDLSASPSGVSSYYVGNNSTNSHLALAPNGKIYYRSKVGFSMQPLEFYLGSIEQPDSAGAACMHRDSVTAAKITINSGNLSVIYGFNLQNTIIDPKYNSFVLNRRYFDQWICKIDAANGYLLEAAEGFSNYVWSDGSTNPQLSVTTGGTYWVKYPTACGDRTDTFHLHVKMENIQMQFDGVNISCQGGYDFYQWQFNGNYIVNANDSFLTVGDDGLYALIAGVGSNCKDTAYMQITTSKINVNQNKAVKVYPNPTKNKLFIESDLKLSFKIHDVSGRELMRGNSSVISLEPLENGMYILFLQSEKGESILREKIIKME